MPCVFSLCNDFRSHGCVFTTVYQRQEGYFAEEEKTGRQGDASLRWY